MYTPQNTQIASFLERLPKIKSRIKRLLRYVPIRKKSKTSMQERLDTANKVLSYADALISPSHDLIVRYQPFTNTPIIHQSLPLLSQTHQAPLPAPPYRFVFASSVIATKGDSTTKLTRVTSLTSYMNSISSLT